LKLIYYKYIVTIIILLSITDITAQNNIFNVTPALEKVAFGKSVEILEDKQGELSIRDVISNELKNGFSTSESDEPNFGFTSSVYWIKFTIKNLSKQNIVTLLEVSYPLIDYIDLYIPDVSGNYVVKSTGDHLPFATRDINHRNFLFRLTLDADGQQTYFMRFKTSSSMNLPLTLWSEKALINKIEIEQLLLGIFFGAVIIMIVYNIFLFIGFREKSFIYLFLFITSWGFAQLTLNGLAFQYLWSSWTWWSDTNLPFFIFASLVTAVQFCRSLLKTKNTIPAWDKILYFQNYFFVAGMILSLLIDYVISIQLASGFAITAILSVSITGLIGTKQGNRSAVIFISAWGLFLLGAILLVVKSFGIIPSNFVTNNSAQVGFFSMMVLFSIAVQDRIESEKKEKQKAQGQLIEALKHSERMLEQKAEERTQEINRINIMLMDRAIELSSINQISEKVNSSLNLSEVLHFACEELVKIFSVHHASISLLDIDNNKLKVVASYSQDDEAKIEIDNEIRLTDKDAFKITIDTKQPLAIQRVQDDVRLISLQEIFKEHNIQSILLVPVVSLKKVIGIISLAVSEEDHEFTKYEIDLARTISIQVASAVENARQYSITENALDIAERDLEIGRQIQAGFFPETIPRIPGWEISAHFKAARQVAGDFFDTFQLDNSKLTAFVIADVCDKGVGAALFMVLFRSLLRAYSENNIVSGNIRENLNSIITNTNNYISKTHSSSNMFASVFFGVLEHSTSEIFYVNAGHDSPVLINSDGKILKRLEPTGPVVGMFPDMNFEVGSIRLHPGDILFAFTDGTTDAVNYRNEFFSEETLLKKLTSKTSSGFSLLFDLNSALDKHIGSSNQFDDITQVIIRKKSSVNENIHSINRIAEMGNLEELRNFVESASINFGLKNDISFALKLSTEEVCTNIINYGYKYLNAGRINISLEHNSEKVTLKISDNGKHFSPDEADTPDINSTLEERKSGGLGLYLIKELMDNVTYKKDDEGSNLLILEKSIR
jgi:serine phosphatase RsbU (regulator of sigma subunit)/anti-sigma regulatory factor (Ser/Thr protein kinase)